MKGKWKQNSKQKKGNAVLQKYMVAVGEFVKSKSGAEEPETGHGLRYVKKKSRKELRKEKRKMKKAKMKSHYEGKTAVTLPPDDGENSGIRGDKQPQVQKKKIDKTKKEVSKTSKPAHARTEKPDNSKPPSSSKKGKKVNKLHESRKMALMEANEQEDREIKKLGRYLGLNKRKNKKSLPQSFVADGLDYILGVLDSGSSAVGMCDDDDDVDMAKENFEKLHDSQLTDEDEEAEEQMSEGSDDDNENEVDEVEEESDEDDDEMADEEEAEEEETDDDHDKLNESDAADSDDENEGEAEEEAESPDAKTSGLKSKAVSSDT